MKQKKIAYFTDFWIFATTLIAKIIYSDGSLKTVTIIAKTDLYVVFLLLNK